ncbi:MAG: DUF4231 domain-containing protein [Candidatus Bathyarchaeota archaeon]
MNKEEFEGYLKDRYYDQTKLYGKKSRYNQKMFKRFQTVIIVFSVLTPILLVLEGDLLTWIAIISSVIVAIGTSLIKMFNYQENWVNYRTTAETLKKEIHYYNAKLFPYHDSKDPEALFVERVENLISRENTVWLLSQKPQQET